MSIISVATRFSSQEECIEYLEEVRWNGNPRCPYCDSTKVSRKKEKGRIGRWNCSECHNSFTVLQGTIFHKTRIPLQKWFLGIALMINAKKGISSCQMARDLDLNQSTCWYMQQRIRAAMAVDKKLLQGIVEADETYVGAKSRYPYVGRATKKIPVIGAVSRKGKVVARIARELTGEWIFKFITEVVDTSKTLLMTDQFRSYNALNSVMEHKVINHSKQYVNGDIHTNTIEGFWSQLKRAWYGQHHHYSVTWMPLYINEACWKYNHRGQDFSDIFYGFLESVVASS